MGNINDTQKKTEESGFAEEKEYSFVQETIKDEHRSAKKTKNLILKYAGLGLVFGITASLGFCALKPWAESQFQKDPEEVTIPVEEETSASAEETEVVVEQALTIDNYRELNKALMQVAEEAEAAQEEKKRLQAEYQDAQDKYEAAQNKYEAAQNKYEAAQNKYEAAQTEISRLAYSRKQEVDPDNYKQFLQGIDTLTPTERKIFEYYLSGKTVKEIIEIAGIKESTLRYHNQNIYSKLNVNSLKQLLRYAALMQQEQNKSTNTH